MSYNFYLTSSMTVSEEDQPDAVYQFTVHKLRGQTHATVSEDVDGSGWQVRWSLLPLSIDAPDEVLVEQFFDGHAEDLLEHETPCDESFDWLRSVADGVLP